MKLGIYSMKDALNGFMNIFPEQNDEMAKRGFLHSLKYAKSDSLFFSNPQDYSLYKLGTFDTESGKLEVISTPEFIVGGVKYED